MDIRSIRTEGLGDSTYILAHDGLGVVVDPQRDIDRFTSVVDELGVAVRWVLETHLHNDYVSGARDMARALDAQLVIPAGAAPVYRHYPAFHNEDLTGNGLIIRPIHTPGHTPEHMSYLTIIDGKETAVFSGGSLLVGSSGRSDLLGMDRAESLARLQHQSIHRLGGLPDTTGLYPTHGAGSFCTASKIASDTSTIGVEKRTNPGLLEKDPERFVTDQLSGLVPYPNYYQYMGPTNLAGTESAPLSSLASISERQFLDIAPWSTVVDARPRTDFAGGHIPGSLGIELRDDFGVWVGWVTPFNTPLVLVLNPNQSIEEAQRQLVRIGYDHIVGVVTDLEDWTVELATYPAHDLKSFVGRLQDGVQLLDVRAPNEWGEGVIDGSLLTYVPELVDGIPEELDQSRSVLVACETGYRASIAASILSREGFQPEVLVEAGIPDVVNLSLT